jgi:prepilin-type N-terminal cleavage/methylation domain-containing protein
MKKNKNFIVANGFSLTELSIVIAIISIILGASFSLILGNTNVAKQKDTENRMKIIEAAIAGFVASYNRLPCGGDITVAASTATAGTEMSSCAGQAYYIVESPAPTSPTTFQSSDVATMVIGSVPYTALKLPKEYIADAWGNKFIYAITKPLSTYSFQYTNMGVIPVRDTTSSYRTNNAAYVLMSSGANGYGGFPMNSTSAQRMVVPTDPGEVINYNTVHLLLWSQPQLLMISCTINKNGKW